MNSQLSQNEVAILIRGRQILKSGGIAKDIDIKGICEAADISRKTGYQWSQKIEHPEAEEKNEIQQELEALKKEHEELKQHYNDLRFENEGRKLAWKLHGVDELLAHKKKAITKSQKRPQQ